MRGCWIVNRVRNPRSDRWDVQLSFSWRVRFTLRRRQQPVNPRPLLAELGGLGEWLDEEDISDGIPFLIAPDSSFDVSLNMYFQTYRMVMASPHTQEAAARDLARFLDFLWFHRPAAGGEAGGLTRPRSWLEAHETDRRAFEWWRCRDAAGPLIAGATWDREVASVNGFYRWAVSSGHVAVSPMVQRASRYNRKRHRSSDVDATVPAEYRPDRQNDRVAWLTPQMYRTWRDVGVRGYLPEGLPDNRFRGRMVARNSAFTDLMIRTGLRLEEQANLTVFDVGQRDGFAGYHRSWLPAAIAKYGSARSVYIPDGVLRDLLTYIEVDRAAAVELAQRYGRYEAISDPLFVETPARRMVLLGGKRIGVDRLEPGQRRRLLIRHRRGAGTCAAVAERGRHARRSRWMEVGVSHREHPLRRSRIRHLLPRPHASAFLRGHHA